MKSVCDFPFLLFSLLTCLGLSNLLCVFGTGLDAPPGQVLVRATDSRIRYNSPPDAPSVWSQTTFEANNGTVVSMETSDPQASVSFTFQGNQLFYYVRREQNLPSLQIALDETVINQPNNAEQHNGHVKILSFSVGGSGVDASENHTVMIQEASGDSDSSWNIVGFSFTTPATGDPLPALPPSMSDASQTPSAPVSGSQKNKKVSGGAVAGIVIGTLLVVGVAALLVYLRCRRRREAVMTPEPLVISPTPTETQRDRSHFHRLYSTLPHFTAPSSIWPTSDERTMEVQGHALPETREVIPERVAPLTLPVIAPRLVAPSPPKQRIPRRPSLSRFFVTNPSSHSSRSRSQRTQSVSEVHLPALPAKDTNLDMLASEERLELEGKMYEKVPQDMPGKETKQLDKGKQRAIDFDIEPTPPSRPRMSRKQSLRRFFFTTNPSPSTSSGSSTSSKKAKSARADAVAAYVQDQKRRIQRVRKLPDPPNIQSPANMSSHSTLPLASIPEKKIHPVSLQPTLEHPPPKSPRSRGSETRFLVTNPSPSMHGHPDELDEKESIMSDIPPPRMDKGKGRAF